MNDMHIAARLLQLRELFASHGISQQDIAATLGVSQSQISRALAGKSANRSSVAKRIVAYGDSIVGKAMPARVVKQSRLIEALATVWDGTDEHAMALELVIRSLGALDRRGAKASAQRWD